jgi:hypothetical protein
VDALSASVPVTLLRLHRERNPGPIDVHLADKLNGSLLIDAMILLAMTIAAAATPLGGGPIDKASQNSEARSEQFRIFLGPGKRSRDVTRRNAEVY